MIRLLRRPSTASTPDTTPEPAPLVPVLRFTTLGGAEVHVTRHEPPNGGRALYGDEHEFVYRWRCTGCDEGTFRYPRNELLRADDARKAANNHAAACRALPGGAL